MKRSTKTGISAGTIALLLGLTGFIGGLQSANRESCELKVDFAHISTYANETGGQKKIKIKARDQVVKHIKLEDLDENFDIDFDTKEEQPVPTTTATTTSE